MRNFIQKYWYARHILAIILVFAFIMFEGGWDFDKSEEDKESNNWASGNTIHSLIIAIIIYLVFLISSKSRLIPNIIFFSLLFILYVTNTYREYKFRREDENNKDINKNNNIIIFEQIIFILAIIVLIFGFIDYYFYQKSQYGDNFNPFKFILGTTSCNSGQNMSSTINMMTNAIKNINEENKEELNKAVKNIQEAIKDNKIASEAIKNIYDAIKR